MSQPPSSDGASLRCSYMYLWASPGAWSPVASPVQDMDTPTLFSIPCLSSQTPCTQVLFPGFSLKDTSQNFGSKPSPPIVTIHCSILWMINQLQNGRCIILKGENYIKIHVRWCVCRRKSSRNKKEKTQKRSVFKAFWRCEQFMKRTQKYLNRMDSRTCPSYMLSTAYTQLIFLWKPV